MEAIAQQGKRVVLIHWKQREEVEVFSNLKNFCISYPQYNYNTLNNYLSKGKIAFENDLVRVERKSIINKPIPAVLSERKIMPVLRRVPLKDAADGVRDLQYWLRMPVQERAAAVTFLVAQMLKKGQRMDKTVIAKIKP